MDSKIRSRKTEQTEETDLGTGISAKQAVVALGTQETSGGSGARKLGASIKFFSVPDFHKRRPEMSTAENITTKMATSRTLESIAAADGTRSPRSPVRSPKPSQHDSDSPSEQPLLVPEPDQQPLNPIPDPDQPLDEAPGQAFRGGLRAQPVIDGPHPLGDVIRIGYAVGLEAWIAPVLGAFEEPTCMDNCGAVLVRPCPSWYQARRVVAWGTCVSVFGLIYVTAVTVATYAAIRYTDRSKGVPF